MRTVMLRGWIGAAVLAGGLVVIAATRPDGSRTPGLATGRGDAAGSRSIQPGEVPAGQPPAVRVGSITQSGRPLDPMRGPRPAASAVTAAAPKASSLSAQPGITAGAPSPSRPAPPLTAAPQDGLPARPVTSGSPPRDAPAAGSLTASSPVSGIPAPAHAGALTAGAPAGFVEEEAPDEAVPVVAMENGEDETVWVVLYGKTRYRAEIPARGFTELRVNAGSYLVRAWSTSCPDPNVGRGVFRTHRKYVARWVRQPAAQANPIALGEPSSGP